MRLYCRDIMPLSFMKDAMDRTRVQGIMQVIFLSALSRSRIAFPHIDKYISISSI